MRLYLRRMTYARRWRRSLADGRFRRTRYGTLICRRMRNVARIRALRWMRNFPLRLVRASIRRRCAHWRTRRLAHLLAFGLVLLRTLLLPRGHGPRRCRLPGRCVEALACPRLGCTQSESQCQHYRELFFAAHSRPQSLLKIILPFPRSGRRCLDHRPVRQSC